jgi:hypothetical protein
MAAILHGLNDWGQVNGRPVWILVVIVSGILFLGYARVGARQDQQFDEALPPALRPHHTEPTADQPDQPEPALTGARHARPWWQH